MATPLPHCTICLSYSTTSTSTLLYLSSYLSNLLLTTLFPVRPSSDRSSYASPYQNPILPSLRNSLYGTVHYGFCKPLRTVLWACTRPLSLQLSRGSCRYEFPHIPCHILFLPYSLYPILSYPVPSTIANAIPSYHIHPLSCPVLFCSILSCTLSIILPTLFYP